LQELDEDSRSGGKTIEFEDIDSEDLQDSQSTKEEQKAESEKEKKPSLK
jgi:hypothetical protein